MAVLTGDQVDSRDLAARAALGDREAFGDLYETTRARVRSHLLRLTADRVVAEDLTAHVYLRALGSIGSWSDLGKDPVAWLYTIATRLASDRAKSAAVRTTYPADPFSPWILEQAGDDNPLGTLLAAERARVVRQAVADITPLQRQCIELRYFQGRSVADTARAMCRTESGIKSLHQCALRALARDERIRALRGCT